MRNRKLPSNVSIGGMKHEQERALVRISTGYIPDGPISYQ